MSFTPADGPAWLRAFLDESPVAVGFSRDGVTVAANPSYVRMFGYADASELVGRPILEQIAPSDRARVVEIVNARARGGSPPARYETRGLRKDGSEFPFDIAITRVVVEDGPLTVAFVFDVSELRASEERFRTLSQAAIEGIFLHADGKILDANAAGEAMYGFAPGEMVGWSLLDLTAPESRALVLEQVRSGGTGPYEGLARRKDGTTFQAEVRARTLLQQGRPARFAIVRDVSEQSALAERVLQAQKLESLGVLAGGVAHDFNNILTVITNEAALARGEAAAQHLDNIAMAASRAAELCRQLLAYAGKAPLVREPVDLDVLVEGTASMLDVSVARGVKVERRLAPGLPRVVGDATQLRQLVMNLVLNASEADARTIVVATGSGTIDLARLVAGEPKPGTYVWLEVKDDGSGMDAETIAQLFDPFFTTKFVGRGLGMAAVLGIVRGHDGAIAIESAKGEGTTVRVYFPASDVAPAKAHEPCASARVLLVEDEANVLRSTQMLLEGLGFDVLVARDGIEAVETFRRAHESAARIDAVLLDLAMPRLGGLDALARLRAIAPDVPVVLTSGYGEVPVRDVAVLAKPYSPQQLVDVLGHVMRR